MQPVRRQGYRCCRKGRPRTAAPSLKGQKQRVKKIHLKRNTLLFVLRDKSAASVAVKRKFVLLLDTEQKENKSGKIGFDPGMAESEASPAGKQVHFGK